jgi:hypothetical protein
MKRNLWATDNRGVERSSNRTRKRTNQVRDCSSRILNATKICTDLSRRLIISAFFASSSSNSVIDFPEFWSTVPYRRALIPMKASHSLTLRMEVMSGGVVSLPNVSITINSAPNTPLSQADTSARAFPKSTNVELKKTFTVSSNQILLTHTGRVLRQRPDQLLRPSEKVATRYFKLNGMANTAWCSDGDIRILVTDCSVDKLPAQP